MSLHRPRLTVGAYQASLRDIAPKITPDLQLALASGALSLADLAAKSGHGFPAVAAAVRSNPSTFTERQGLVRLV